MASTPARSTFLFLIGLMAFGGGCAPTTATADVPTLEAARGIADNCITCHQPHGRGSMPDLARLSADEIAAKLKRFKSGELSSTIMGRHAKAYSDAEIDALAHVLGQTAR